MFILGITTTSWPSWHVLFLIYYYFFLIHILCSLTAWNCMLLRLNWSVDNWLKKNWVLGGVLHGFTIFCFTEYDKNILVPYWLQLLPFIFLTFFCLFNCFDQEGEGAEEVTNLRLPGGVLVRVVLAGEAIKRGETSTNHEAMGSALIIEWP